MNAVPDKSFMQIPRKKKFYDNRYAEGFDAFLNYAEQDVNRFLTGRLYCPCIKCKNFKLLDRATVREHLIRWHFLDSYTHWDRHGEGLEFTLQHASSPTGDEADGTGTMIDDLIAGYVGGDGSLNDYPAEVDEQSNEVEKLMKLMEDNEKELYDGCSEFTRLSFVVRLLHFQSVSGLSNVHFDMLLDLLRIVLPNGKESIPRSHYEASKLVKALGFDYEKIHACPNDCILYRKDHADLSECPKCGVSRWRQKKRPAVSARPGSVTVDKIPAKILRYFPLTKQLQRFYMTKNMSKNMR